MYANTPTALTTPTFNEVHMATENSTLFTKRPNGRYAPATRQNICEAATTYAELPRRQEIHDSGAVASYLVAKFSDLEYEDFLSFYWMTNTGLLNAPSYSAAPSTAPPFTREKSSRKR